MFSYLKTLLTNHSFLAWMSETQKLSEYCSKCHETMSIFADEIPRQKFKNFDICLSK